MKPVRKDSERGFALLLVFLMAAAVALMLYRQLPRVAFETEREKEQVLIDRGEQYERAIQLFLLANKRWPASIEELEKFQDKRYLRRRYVDPMTGKDEWRLIHTNGAYLTDSLVTKPPTADDKTKPTTTTAAATSPTGVPGAPEAPPEANVTVARRPSDRIAPPAYSPNAPPLNTAIDYSADPNQQQQQQQQAQNNFNQNNFNPYGNFGQNNPNGADPYAFNPATLPPITLLPGGTSPTVQPQPFNPQFPGQQFPGQQPLPGQVAAPGQSPQQQGGYKIDANGQFVPIAPAQNQVGGQPGLQQPQTPGQPPSPFAPNTNPFPNAGQNPSLRVGGGISPAGAAPANPANPAINLINQLLTTPRQAPTTTTSTPGTTQGQSAIAGVASTSTAASIKRYKDRAKYNEWEFVFEQQQQQAIPGQGNNPLGQPGTPGAPAAPGTPAAPAPTGAPNPFQLPQK